MKISLIRRNYHSHLITPPLGLGYLSSYLKNKGHKVRIIDGLNQNLSNEKIVDLCFDDDLTGVSILSSYICQASDLVKKLKSKGKKVVIGGPHVSALTENVLNETGADYAVSGEGEETFAAIADAIDNNNHVNRISGNIGDFIEELDSIPFPDWDQINPVLYKKAPHGGLIKSFPVAPLVTSRGCPYECTFCASPKLWNKRIRFRSPENIIEEIKYLVKKFKVKEIHFEDDNLTLKKDHIIKICELMLRENIKVSWATPNGVRADTLDSDIIKLMKGAGCYYLAFGIESGDEAILKNIKKRTNLEIIQKAINLARKAGIMTQGFFIFGLPGETEKSIRKTIDFAKKSGLDRAQFLLLDVLPGSSLWDDFGSLRCINIRQAKSYQDVTWIPEGLNRELLLNAQSQAFKEFFLRPKQFFDVLKYFRLSQLSFVWSRARDYRVFKQK